MQRGNENTIHVDNKKYEYKINLNTENSINEYIISIHNNINDNQESIFQKNRIPENLNNLSIVSDDKKICNLQVFMFCKSKQNQLSELIKAKNFTIKSIPDQEFKKPNQVCYLIISSIYDYVESLIDNKQTEFSLFKITKIQLLENLLKKLLLNDYSIDIKNLISEIQSKIEILNNETKKNGPFESVQSENFGEIYYNTNYSQVHLNNIKRSMERFLDEIFKIENPSDEELFIIYESIQVLLETEYSDELSFNLHENEVYDYETYADDSMYYEEEEENEGEDENEDIKKFEDNKLHFRVSKTFKNSLLFKYTN